LRNPRKVHVVPRRGDRSSKRLLNALFPVATEPLDAPSEVQHRRGHDRDEGDLLTYLLAGLAMLGTLVLAWRGYRHESREDRERKKAVKRKSTVKR
jgi:hypothetical protein